MYSSLTTAKALFDYLLHQITVYERQEAKEIVFWLLEHYLNLKKIDILSDKQLNKSVPIDWKSIIARLNKHEPVQYILGETTFYGRSFLVDANVLIPRSETEELIEAVKSSMVHISNAMPKILDIGTGSGCIAITLAKEIAGSEVFAWDISKEALDIAKKNALLNTANVIFDEVDVLNISSLLYDESFSRSFDIIVSNPPYVTFQEIEQMRKNVVDFEPHLALFVENNKPLIFYEAIANFAYKSLPDKGLVIVEINENLGLETAEVFTLNGFSDVEIIRDIYQKNRFVKARLLKKDWKA